MKQASLALLLAAMVGVCADPQMTLTVENFDELARGIKPSRDESAWSNIHWMTDLWEARQKAAKEGKPLVVWTMSGEPLGFC